MSAGLLQDFRRNGQQLVIGLVMAAHLLPIGRSLAFAADEAAPTDAPVIKIPADIPADLHDLMMNNISEWPPAALTETAILYMARARPSELLSNGYERIADRDFTARALDIAAKAEPLVAMMNLHHYKDRPSVRAAYHTARSSRDQLVAAASRQPKAAFLHYHLYKDLAFARDVLMAAARADPCTTFGIMGHDFGPHYKDMLKAATEKGALMRALEDTPHAVMASLGRYAARPYAVDVLRAAIQKGPGFYYLARKDIHEKLGRTRAAPLDAFAHAQYLQHLQDGRAQRSQYPGFCLALVRTVNDLHEAQQAVRFAPIDGFNAEQLFDLVTYGREEIYTSSFAAIMDRLQAALQREGKTYLSFGQDERTRPRLAVFLEAAASYGRIDRIFQTLPSPEDRAQMVDTVYQSIADGFQNPRPPADDAFEQDNGSGAFAPTLRQLVGVLEVMRLSQGAPQQDLLERFLIRHFETAAQEPHQRALGLLISSYLASVKTPLNPDVFAQEDFRKNYPIAQIEQLDEARLFTHGKHYQQIYFYDDPDGVMSYGSFMDSLRQAPKGQGWSMQDKGRFVVLSKQAHGRQIILVANKPKAGQAGQDEASAYLRDKPVHSLVHRGHSFWLPPTQKHFAKQRGGLSYPSPAFAVLGSCGGFQQIGPVMDILPETSNIVSTQGTGSRGPNNAISAALYDQMLQRGSIDWRLVWDAARKTSPSEYFHAYVNPLDNLGVLYYRSFIKMEGMGAYQSPSVPVRTGAVVDRPSP